MSAPGSEGFARRRGLLIALAVFATLFALAPMSAYGDSGDDGAIEEATVEDAAGADLFTVTPAQAATLRAAHPAKAKGPKQHDLLLRVLSNRASLISGGDALVEVVLPEDVAASDVRVTVDGRDVTSAFALRADGTFTGLVDGLAPGRNEVVATTIKKGKAKRPTHLTIKNHPASGPVFSGEQLQPWVCAFSRTAPP